MRRRLRINENTMLARRDIFGGFGNSLFQYAYLYAQYRRGEIPDLYVQDERWFAPYKEEIKALFGSNIEPIDMVSLHVRRGDYVGNDFYVDLTETDYYEKAMAEFPAETKFLVFCADRQAKSNDEVDERWVKEWWQQTFPDKKFYYYRGINEVQDFNAQAGCKGHITANSSFSWWSAYVGGGKTVIPAKWFSDGVERISLPDEWIKL